MSRYTTNPSMVGASIVGPAAYNIVRNYFGAEVGRHYRRYFVKDGERKKKMWWEPRGVDPKGNLYGLEHLRTTKHQKVIVVEGELAVDFLRPIASQLGYEVVGTVCGAEAVPHESVLAYLRPFEVVVWADNDDDGRRHMQRISLVLQRWGMQVKAITWVEAQEKGDAHDWVDRGGNAQQLQALIDAGTEIAGSSGLTLSRASQITPTKVKWLQKGRLAFGKVTLLYSNPGDGKSLIGADYASCATTGRDWFDADNPVGPVSVMILSAEDDPEDTIVPRLQAAGADLDRVFIHTLGDEKDDALSIPGDVPKIEDAIRQHSIQFLVVDTLYDYLDLKHDSHRTQDVRQGLRPLVGMARRTGCCVLVISHPNKQQGQAAIYRNAGSLAVLAYSRLAFVVGRDQTDKELRVLAPVKSNIAREAPSLSYYVRSWHVDEDVAVIEWQGLTTATADEVLAGPQDEGEKSKIDQAATLIGEILRDGPVGAVEVTKEVMQTVGCSKVTVHNAAKRMGLKILKKGFREGWEWDLPLRVVPKIHTQREDLDEALPESSVDSLNLRGDPPTDLTEDSVPVFSESSQNRLNLRVVDDDLTRWENEGGR